MHMGHYCKHVNRQMRGLRPNRAQFFANNKWIEFLMTSLSLWMQSLPPETHAACCELDILGGDGTGIGITAKKAMELTPIWEPTVLTQPRLTWGRRDRAISRIDCGRLTSKQASELIQWLEKLTQPDADVASIRKQMTKMSKLLHEDVVDEVTRWVFMEDTHPEYNFVRKLIRSYSSDESVTGLMKPHSLDLWKAALAYLNPQSKQCEPVSKWVEDCKELCNSGIGPEATAIINLQIAENGVVRIRKSTWRFLTHIGECIAAL